MSSSNEKESGKLMIAAARIALQNYKLNVKGSDYIEVIRLLIKAGANINHRDRNKDTALSRAKEAGHSDIVKLLR